MFRKLLLDLDLVELQNFDCTLTFFFATLIYFLVNIVFVAAIEFKFNIFTAIVFGILNIYGSCRRALHVHSN